MKEEPRFRGVDILRGGPDLRAEARNRDATGHAEVASRVARKPQARGEGEAQASAPPGGAASPARTTRRPALLPCFDRTETGGPPRCPHRRSRPEASRRDLGDRLPERLASKVADRLRRAHRPCRDRTHGKEEGPVARRAPADSAGVPCDLRRGGLRPFLERDPRDGRRPEIRRRQPWQAAPPYGALQGGRLRPGGPRR